MSFIFRSIASFCMLATLIQSGCTGGTGEGNPEFGRLSVALRAQSENNFVTLGTNLSSPGLAKQTATDTLMIYDEHALPYFIHHIYAHVDRVEFTRPLGAACHNNDSITCTDTSVAIATHRLIDLLQKPSPLILDDLPLPIGLYKRMKIHFANLDSASGEDIPAEYLSLIGHSILMKGRFSYGGVANRDLTIFLAINDLLPFENGPGLAIESDREYTWAGIFRAGGWLKNLELKECLDEGKIAVQPDGSVVIDETSECNELEDSLETHVRNSTYFELED